MSDGVYDTVSTVNFLFDPIVIVLLVLPVAGFAGSTTSKYITSYTTLLVPGSFATAVFNSPIRYCFLLWLVAIALTNVSSLFVSMP